MANSMACKICCPAVILKFRVDLSVRVRAGSIILGSVVAVVDMAVELLFTTASGLVILPSPMFGAPGSPGGNAIEYSSAY